MAAEKQEIYTPPAVTPDTLDKPRFDFSNVSFKDARESGRLRLRIQHANKRIEAASASDDIDLMIAELDNLLDQQMKIVFSTVEYLPPAWLVRNAPPAKDIDWRDPSSQQWLRGDRFETLTKAKDEAENSPN